MPSKKFTVTHPDGTTSTRSSKSAEYAFAVVAGPADPAKRAAHLEAQAVEFDRMADVFEAAMARDEVKIVNRGFRMVGDLDVDHKGEPYFHNFEMVLLGTKPATGHSLTIRCNSKGEHEAHGFYDEVGEYQSYPKVTKTGVRHDGTEYSYETTDTRVVSAHEHLLGSARGQVYRWRWEAEKARAAAAAYRAGEGDLGGYGVLRWSRSRDLAAKAAQGEFAGYTERGYSVTVVPVD